jgi:hypothetical protein
LILIKSESELEVVSDTAFSFSAVGLRDLQLPITNAKTNTNPRIHGIFLVFIT